MSSTSNEVCELFDGKKVVRLEGTKPLIQELIYAGEWYDLKEARTSGEILINHESGGEDKRARPRRLEEGEERAVPPNQRMQNPSLSWPGYQARIG